jgi:hypothetical protein
MSKPVTLIMKLKYPHRKQIKTVCKAQFSTESILNDKNLEKKSIKKNIKNNPSKPGLTC